MGNHRVNAFAALESTASPCVGVVELWHGVGEIVWHHQRGCHPRTAAQAIQAHQEATFARTAVTHQAEEGNDRQALEVNLSSVLLLRWVLSWWDPGEHRLALAMDASTLSDRFTVLAISVLYRGWRHPRGLENRAQQ